MPLLKILVYEKMYKFYAKYSQMKRNQKSSRYNAIHDKGKKKLRNQVFCIECNEYFRKRIE